MERNWTIRHVVEQDFPQIAAVESARGPEKVAESQVREWEEHSRTDEQNPMEWFVAVEQDGTPNGRFLGWGTQGKSDWLGPRERQVYAGVLPANRGMGVGAFLLDYAESRVARDNPAAIYAWCRASDPYSMQWARDRGYAVHRERTESVLDLDRFDTSEFRQALESVKQAGFEIRTMWDDQITPHLPGLYRVSVESFRDVPFRAAGATDVTYEAWLKEIQESACRKLFAIAFHEGQVVGYSDLWMPVIEGGSAGVDYTGVLKEYRGRGIALAVKVASTVEGAKAGVKRIMTNNDPDNPAILHLNERMGFKRVPGPVILKKSLA